MSWKRNFIPVAHDGCMSQQFLTRVEDGKFSRIVPRSADEVYKDLPSPEMFTLDSQLAAGIPLQEVNCQLLDVSEKISNKQLQDFMEDVNKAKETEPVTE